MDASDLSTGFQMLEFEGILTNSLAKKNDLTAGTCVVSGQPLEINTIRS